MADERGFTLIEVLVVVVLLGILATMVLPQFSNATATARISMLKDDLRVLRSQILLFQVQHNGVAPGYLNGNTAAAPSEAAFTAQMTQSSNASCQTAPAGTAGFPYGPYMQVIPVNPRSDKSTVQIIGDAEAMPATGDDSHGWIYKPAAVSFKADSPGTDDTGKAFIDY